MSSNDARGGSGHRHRAYNPAMTALPADLVRTLAALLGDGFLIDASERLT